MPNSLVKNDIHLVFHVKYDGVTVSRDDLPRLFDYIGGIIRSLGGISFIVGGVSDHVHALVSVPPTIAVADFARAVKAKSSKWIKSISPRYNKFAWQKAMGLSPSVLLCWTRQRDISPIRKNTIDKEPFVKKWICSQKRII